MEKIEIKLTDEQIKNYRNQLDHKIRGVEAVLSKKGLLYSGAHIKEINRECLGYVSNCATQILKISIIEARNNKIYDRDLFYKIFQSNLNPEISYAKKLLTDQITKISQPPSMDKILNALNFDGESNIIIQETNREFDKNMIILEKENINERRENSKLFWLIVGSIAAIITAVATITHFK